MRQFRRGGVLAAVLGLILAATAPTAAAAGSDSPSRYRNPISVAVGDTFADPVIVRGEDGFWYAYGTTDPLHEGEREFHRVPIARSANLVDWRTSATRSAPTSARRTPLPGLPSGRLMCAASATGGSCT